MATIRVAGTTLFASLLIGVGLSSVTTAKKPGTEPPPPLPPPVYYQIYWLGSLGGLHTRANDVNDSGTVVGGSSLAGSNMMDRPFVCQAPAPRSAPQVIAVTDLNTMVPLPNGVVLLTASCVNNVGRIAGTFADDQDRRGAFVYDLATNLTSFLPCDAFNGRTAEHVWIKDLNENGVVVGGFEDADWSWGFVWDPAGTTGSDLIVVDLPNGGRRFGSLGEWLSGINDNLDIVGCDGTTVYRWTVDPSDWTHGDVLPTRDILTDSGADDLGWAGINGDGVVASSIRLKSSGFVPAYYTDDHGWKLADLNRKEIGWCYAINREGQICGALCRSDYKLRDTGFVYGPADGLWSLDELVDADDPWWAAGDFSDDTIPLGMSDAVDGAGYGMIVGYKWLSARIAPAGQNSRWGFVLMPAVP